MNYQQLIDVGLSDDLTSFERRLVATADAMGFPIISGALLRSKPKESDEVQGLSFGNTPEGHAEAFKDVGETMRDPVFERLMSQPLPVVYNQATYVAAGVGEMWEMQAPYGFKTGIAVKLQLQGEKQFLLGVDREDALPEPGSGLTQMMGELQLLAVHAMTAADRLLGRKVDSIGLPKLTKRELDALSWTAQGKTAWEISVILGMSEKTVNFHLGNVMRKLDVNSKHQAVLKCLAAGVL